ncbi:unnamed protein product [Rotaria sp. Silwood1]|nr:unnamed protein product [Rotaria sp. Silwood1]
MEGQSSVSHTDELQSKDSVGSSDLSYVRFTDTRKFLLMNYILATIKIISGPDEQAPMKMKEKFVPAPPPPPPPPLQECMPAEAAPPQLSTSATMRQTSLTKGQLSKTLTPELLARPFGSTGFSMAQPQGKT